MFQHVVNLQKTKLWEMQKLMSNLVEGLNLIALDDHYTSTIQTTKSSTNLSNTLMQPTLRSKFDFQQNHVINMCR